MKKIFIYFYVTSLRRLRFHSLLFSLLRRSLSSFGRVQNPPLGLFGQSFFFVPFSDFVLTIPPKNSCLRVSLSLHSSENPPLGFYFTKSSCSLHFVFVHIAFCFFGTTFVSLTFALRKIRLLDFISRATSCRSNLNTSF